MRGFEVLAVLALVGCPKGGGAPVAASGPMRMAWPDGAVGDRRAERFTRHEVGGESRERLIRARETVQVARDAEGWRLRTVDGRFESVAGAPPEAALAALVAVPQEVRIGPEGAYVGLIEPGAWANAARDAMHAVLDPADVMGQIQVDLAVQPEKLDETLGREWRSLVGFWIGREPVVGPIGEVPGTDARGEPGPMSTALAVEAGAACGESACVWLVARSPIDPDALARRGDALLRAWVEALPEPPGAATVEGLEGEVVVRVLADPRTLLPHRYEATETSRGTLKVDARSLPFATEEGKTVTWTWTGGGP